MIYICSILILCLCSFCTSDITQAPSLQTSVGHDLNITCNHDAIVGTEYIHWYKLSAGHWPIFLIGDFKDHETEDKKFKLTFGEGKKSNVLLIKDIRFEDSSMYLCAKRGGTGGYKYVFGQGTKLQIIPKTEQKDPSVYKLKSSKQGEGLPNFVCLVTDFPNPQTNLTVDGIESSLSATAVLDKSTNDVWRYSTVVWDNNNDVDCRMRYGDGNEIYPKSDPENAEETCSSLSIDASFRTNPSLNTLSQTVLGWRALTAKAIIFNLIITLRLWSS